MEGAPCGCGARGDRGAVQADRPEAGDGPECPTLWGRWSCKGVGVPDEGPTVGPGPGGKPDAFTGGRGRGRGPGCGGRSRLRRRQRARVPEAGAGRCVRDGRRLVVPLGVPHGGVDGRSGGVCDVQVGRQRAHVQGVGVPDEDLTVD